MSEADLAGLCFSDTEDHSVCTAVNLGTIRRFVNKRATMQFGHKQEIYDEKAR